MHTVFLLGAGFSAPFGLPPLAGFFEQVLDDPKLDREDRHLLTKLRLQVRQSFGFLAGEDSNIEHILSFAQSQEHNSRVGPVVFDEVARILRMIYGRFGGTAADRRVIMNLAQFLRVDEIPADWTFGVVTTNYDLVAEYAFNGIGRALSLPLSHRRASHAAMSMLAPASPSAPRLYKLHGSVNWALEEEGLIVEDGLLPGFDIASREATTVPIICTPDYVHAAPPVLIPPTFFKETPSPLFEDIRQAAWLELASAHNVVVVGYSFPPSDPHMRYFVSSALATGSRFRKLRIVDPNARGVLANLKAGPSPIGALLESKIELVESGWVGYCPGVG